MFVLGMAFGYYVELPPALRFLLHANSSDVEPTIAFGAPWISLNQDGMRYFDYHHTPDDTLDKVDPEQLRQNVAAWAAMLATLSGGIEPEPKRAQRR